MKKIIKFEKKDCNSCQLVSVWLDAREIEYERINAFDNPMAAAEMKVRSVPTVILVKDGKEIRRSTGFKPEELEELVKEL